MCGFSLLSVRLIELVIFVVTFPLVSLNGYKIIAGIDHASTLAQLTAPSCWVPSRHRRSSRPPPSYSQSFPPILPRAAECFGYLGVLAQSIGGLCEGTAKLI